MEIIEKMNLIEVTAANVATEWNSALVAHDAATDPAVKKLTALLMESAITKDGKKFIPAADTKLARSKFEYVLVSDEKCSLSKEEIYGEWRKVERAITRLSGCDLQFMKAATKTEAERREASRNKALANPLSTASRKWFRQEGLNDVTDKMDAHKIAVTDKVKEISNAVKTWGAAHVAEKTTSTVNVTKMGTDFAKVIKELDKILNSIPTVTTK
tara:strand:- start:134 stop:775 length:642 start_codon:yes stop_codon:yes gene_type:complete